MHVVEYTLWSNRNVTVFITARCFAECNIAMANCLSVCPSVTLRYRDHKSWNSSKIILKLISLSFFLFENLNIIDLLKRKLPKF